MPNANGFHRHHDKNNRRVRVWFRLLFPGFNSLIFNCVFGEEVDSVLSSDDRDRMDLDLPELEPSVEIMPHQKLPSPSMDQNLPEMSTLRHFRDNYMLHYFPLHVREPIECEELNSTPSLAEKAFFWASVAMGARAVGSFDHGASYMKKAEFVWFLFLNYCSAIT